ncbi:MAG: preprotein translocase subunit SecG [Gammaproteobacteria bacterium RIFCSPHIGHO2_12_FULL_37_14]|nr:MAG: preprotein translocase subunit SecG [Gammaproteobacteria bacterium RIFCSPHIGHO2_12_FULL_37_14]
MYQLVMFIHIFAAACMIIMVLVQQGKGATMGAAFGSGASQTVFGSRGSGSFLFKMTMGLIGVFFITSLALNYLSTSAYHQTKVMTLPALPVQQKTTAPTTETMTPGQIPAPQAKPEPMPLPKGN